jgi:iron only hydrogenase large subunit-like protein
MVFAGRIARKRYPDALTVFISPCTAKRHEALETDEIDYVLSFEELGALMIANNLEIDNLEGLSLENQGCSAAHNFARSGGVAAAILQKAGEAFIPEIINGLDKKSIRLLKQIARGKTDANFVEVMSCEGGCIGGVNTIMKGRMARKAFESN